MSSLCKEFDKNLVNSIVCAMIVLAGFRGNREYSWINQYEKQEEKIGGEEK